MASLLNYWTPSEVKYFVHTYVPICLGFEEQMYTLSETDFTIIMPAAAAPLDYCVVCTSLSHSKNPLIADLCSSPLNVSVKKSWVHTIMNDWGAEFHNILIFKS